ncbi:LysR substrate-binding domain-containing protein [Methylobacterium sp. ID0610]|uniref:LysR substrate-binding domain-containing protein n=1 Tax=Methylobacterium carpenticola TaxID=3344827 RepID=UPI00367DC011
MQIPIRSISIFHAVAQAASISKAAESLGVTPSAVSQQIQSLETYLGTALIAKDGRNIVLTEAGERYYEMISSGVESIAEATHRIRGFRAVTALMVRSTPSLSSKWLMPRLKSFIDTYPGIEVRVDGTNEPTIFGKESVDIEIRHGDGKWPGLYVEKIANETFFPVCSPDLCPDASIDAADIWQHRLIYSVKSQVPWERWFACANVIPPENWGRILFDRSHMVIDAAVRGMGIALESDLMSSEELEDGRLVCPVRNPPLIQLDTHWIVCPHDHLRHKRVKIFLEWIRHERDVWQSQRTHAPNDYYNPPFQPKPM